MVVVQGVIIKPGQKLRINGTPAGVVKEVSGERDIILSSGPLYRFVCACCGWRWQGQAVKAVEVM